MDKYRTKLTKKKGRKYVTNIKNEIGPINTYFMELKG